MNSLNHRNSEVAARRAAAAVVLCAVALLSGCGKEDGAKSKAAASKPAAETTATAATDLATTAPATADATAVSAGQLDFFTERYISADERLTRRQHRIEEVLASGSPAGPG